jgi:mannose-P-dolichol utilization defect protein 1
MKFIAVRKGYYLLSVLIIICIVPGYVSFRGIQSSYAIGGKHHSIALKQTISPQFSKLNIEQFYKEILYKKLSLKNGKNIFKKLKITTTLYARLLGFIIGAGASFLYVPIIKKLLKNKNSTGLSVETWYYNLIGYTAAIIYPLKMNFPISTYIDGISLCLQSLLILGIIETYSNRRDKYLALVMFYVISIVLLVNLKLSTKIFQILQIFASIFCNYAQVPQIIMNQRMQRSEWSLTSSAMSFVGNLIRIFTTRQLTNDPLIMGGHVVGVLTNGVLLLQGLLFKSRAYYKKQ